MHPLDSWGEAYLRLTLRLDKHIPGYVDAYVGPPELREAVDLEQPRPAAALLQDVDDLQEELSQQRYASSRQSFLQKQLRAIETTIRKLNGHEFSYREEVERCFDISPPWVDEEQFLSAHSELEELLPGEGLLGERLQAYRDRFTVPEDQVLPLVQTALDELRRRTSELIVLPEGEQVHVTLVREQPWSAYNWYLGQGCSRIELNLDLPTRALNLMELFAHEAYPGHHTEGAIKEQLLYREQGHAEAAVAPLNTPANVVGEGIGNVGIRVIFADDERIHWKNAVLYPQAGLGTEDVEQALRLERAQRALRFVSGNAALLLHEKGWLPEKVVSYMERYALRTREEAEHSLRFIQSPLFRAYIYCYTAGETLIEAAMERTGERQGLFKRLLCDPWTPSALATLAGEVSSPAQ